MKKVFKLSLFLLFVFFSFSLFAKSFSGKCVGISDGDTIKVMKNGVSVKVRLHGIDCPEKEQAFGNRAKQFTSSKVFGKRVRVEVQYVDDYGRTVGEVFIEGKSLNLMLIQNGFAWHYKKYSKNKTYAKAEKKARKKHLGLWKDKHPIAPWTWRWENWKKK